MKVKVAVAGICGSDIPRVWGTAAHSYPRILGHEFAGTVVEIGDGVEDVSIGDSVAGAPLLPCHACSNCQKGDYALCSAYGFIGSRDPGAFAEYVSLPRANIVVLSPSLPLEQAVFFEVAAVALHALRHNGFTGGKRTVVLGCGAVGIFLLQWAKLFGARSLVAIGRGEERLRVASRYGTDAEFSIAEADGIEQALAFVSGAGFDQVFEAAGSVDAMRAAFTLAAPKARVCFVGTPTADLTFTVKQWEQINRKEFLLAGSWMGYSSPFPGEEWSLTSEAMASGRIRAEKELIFRRFPLREAAKAFELFRTPGSVKGRVLLFPEWE